MVVMVMVMLGSCGERRSSENQDQERGSKDLFHGGNLAWRQLWKQLRLAR